jgi:hypothetical protein
MAVDNLPGQPSGPQAVGLSRRARQGLASSLPSWLRLGVEALAVLVLAALAVRVRHPGRLFTHPFWLDESWVAVSTRAPWGQLDMLTSSTPIGWTALLRAVPRWGDAERYRLLPLAFIVAGVVPAWFLGRQLGSVSPLGRWIGPPAAGLAAVLGPTALGYPYLKQYTAESFTSLLLVALVVWLERGWSPRRLGVLTLTAALSFLVANTALLVTAAAFGGLTLTSLLRRAWRRVGWFAAAGIVVAAADLWIYRAFVEPSNSTAMQRYWKAWYIPATDGWDLAWRFAGPKAVVAIESIGFGPWPLALALVVAGVVALWRVGAPAAALVVPALVVEVAVGGVLRRYPFLEQRTSMFLTVLASVLAALGVAAVAAVALRSRWTAVLGLAAIVGVGAIFLLAARQAVRTPMFDENTRGIIRLVLELRRPGDVVVLGSAAAYQWAYYAPERPTFLPASAIRTVRFRVAYPGYRDLIVATERDPASVKDALRRLPPGTRRAWIVLSHEDHLLPVWARTAGRLGGRLAAPPANPCSAFTEAERVRAEVSVGQCPMLVRFDDSALQRRDMTAVRG